MTDTPMIETDQLTRSFGARNALDRVTFSVPRGRIVGFLGPNGAGKSTTLKILAGYLPPTGGAARVGGFDVVEDSLEARRLLGYMPESFPHYPEMRVEEYLSFRAELKGVRNRKAAVERSLDLADVKDVARRIVGELSKGYKQRVGFADALLGKPPLLILDEPTEGLDPNQILKFREVLKGLGEEHTIFLSTHILSEVEAVCADVVIIHQGRIAAQGPIQKVRAELTPALRPWSLLLAVKAAHATPYRDDALGAARKVLETLDGVAVAEVTRVEENVYRVELSARARTEGDDDVIESVVARCVGEGLGVREVVSSKRSLEDVFHSLTTVAASEASAKADETDESP
jgi:ABC-2 type transport system ATP-binding protein